MDLDAPQHFSSIDPADALRDVEATAEQWREAAAVVPKPLNPEDHDAIVVAGMGGSGIAGDVLWALGLRNYPRPVVVHKSYGVPGFTGPRTLVVAVSHSGSTEETLSAFTAAGAAGATRLVVTSGGELGSRAAAEGVRVERIAAGDLPPRHSLGSLLVPLLRTLRLDDGLAEAIDVLESTATEMGRGVATAANPAKQIARRVVAGALPLTWGAHGLPAVAAYRLKCQLNENAKLPAMHAELPEAGHNDVVGWEGVSPLTGVGGLIALRDPAGEEPAVSRRFDLTGDLLDSRLAWREELTARGTSALARVASLLLQADLLSVYAAIAGDRDPTPVASIDRLKSRLDEPASAR